MLPLEENRKLVDDLDLLAGALEALEMESSHRAVAGLAGVRDRLARSIRSYLIPRVSGDELPLTVVFAGPTGSGKSTLVNSLSGVDISETGPLRPTTKEPLVLSSAWHAPAFQRISGVACEVVEGGAPILAEVAFVDTPDIDSTSAENRVIAEILIDNADIVVFVTSVLRYSDLVPWEVLRRAVSRGVPVLHVLNRITPSSAAAIAHFRARLRREGLEPDIVRIAEHHVAPELHHVPSIALRQLQRRVVGLVDDVGTTRREILDRVMSSIAMEVMALAEGLDARIEGIGGAEQSIRSSFRGAVEQLELKSMFGGRPIDDVPDSRMRRLGWLWRNRMGRDRWEAGRSGPERRLAALVEADLRRLATGEGLGVPMEVAVEARKKATQAMAGWLEELLEVAGSNRVVGTFFAARVLADASVRRERTPAFDHLYADPRILADARRSLDDRLEPIYESTVERLFERSDWLSFDRRDSNRLRARASSLVMRSHLADA